MPGKNVGQADAVMVLAANLDTGKVTAIGIPRDSMVEVGEFMGSEFTGMSTMQLCLAFAYGDGGETSSQYTTAAVSRVLYNMPVNNYVSLDMDSVGELANAVGGVPVTPLQSIPGTNIVKGQDTVLFGSNALKYIQWRDTSVLNSSLDRQARQSQFVQAFCKEAFAQAKKMKPCLLLIDVQRGAQQRCYQPGRGRLHLPGQHGTEHGHYRRRRNHAAGQNAAGQEVR